MSDKENNRRQIGKNYEVLRTIGKGGFGTVYLCEDRVTKLQCAVKEIQLPKSSSPSAKINPKEEIQIHRMLASKRSNRFVRIHDDFVCDGFVYLVMEYCKEGSLRDYVKKNGPMGVLLATDVLTQLCDALKLIHEEDIAHRDLTPNNVLISEIRRGRLSDEVKRIRVKVTDFGLSKKTPNNAQGQGQFKTTLGTGPFMAPEVKLGKYTKEADMFSLGSLFYFLLTKNYLPDQTAAKQQNLGGGKQQLDLDPMMDKLRAQHSVRELEPAVQSDLERFLRKLLCSEKGRIRLDKIDVDPFITWFYTERYVIDPELRDLCSHSQSGAFGGGGGRRRSRSRSVDNKPQAAGAGAAAAYRHQQQLEVAALPKRPNRDSALGSDQQSRSGSSRCRHPHVDLDTGQCISCRFWVTTAINNGTTSRPKEPLASTSARRRIPFYDEMCVSEPIIGKPEKFGTDLTNHRRPTSSSQCQSQHNQQQQKQQHQQQPPPPPPLTVRTEPAAFGGVAGKKAYVHGNGRSNDGTTIYSQEVPPWPFPVVTHDYRANNAYGRCIFFRHSNPTTTTAGGGGGGELQLVAVLEKTAVSPAEDQTVRRIFELWQNGVDQELRVFEPANPKAKLPAEKGARRIETGREIVPRIKSQQQYQRICRTGKEGGGGEEKIKDGYEKMWAFLKLASSKIAQAYCEEIVEGGRRYRVELCLNGWAKAYVGSKETRADIAALKLCGQQKTEDSPFEQRNQKEVSLRRDELELLEELAKALRAHVRQSVWRSRKFDRRNIRCTDYTSGYR